MSSDGSDRAEGHQPLSGVRVLEVTETAAGRVAGMLLACLGADVARIRTGSAAGIVPTDVASLTWDRSKQLVDATITQAAQAARLADIFIVDRPPRRLREDRLEARMLRADSAHLIHLWLPPYAERGEWRDLQANQLLLDAAGGVAAQYPATDDRPVAPAFAATAQLHGALGAGAAIAALIGRRNHGEAAEVVVSGLHAVAAQIAVVTPTGIDTLLRRRARSGFVMPHWRLYRTGDGQWVFLATLTERLFRRALEAMGRADIMDLPGVSGDFRVLVAEQDGSSTVAQELETEFARRPASYWLDLFESFDVPCAAVADRSDWARSEIVAETHSMVQFAHPALGEVRAVGAPFAVSDCPPWQGALPSSRTLTDLVEEWGAALAAAEEPDHRPAAATGLPLRGVKVVDASSFLAGPFGGALLADWGAEVVKVEPPGGDPYRVSVVASLVANLRKRSLAADLGSPAGREAFLALLADADVLIENFRPGRLDKFGLDEDTLAQTSPGLVHCKVSAYASSGPYAGAPGFDPVLQSRSGMVMAQGGPRAPQITLVPLNDTGTGALGALVCLAGLFASGRRGRAVRVEVSLARTATFLQSGELTEFTGRSAVAEGCVNFAGPTSSQHFYRCADGWVAIAATTDEQIAQLTALMGEDAAEIERALRVLPVAEALSRLSGESIPAVRIPSRDRLFDDPFLLANDFIKVVKDPVLGRVKTVWCYADWRTNAGRPAARSLSIGHDTRTIMTELGYSSAVIDDLVVKGVLSERKSN